MPELLRRDTRRRRVLLRGSRVIVTIPGFGHATNAATISVEHLMHPAPLNSFDDAVTCSPPFCLVDADQSAMRTSGFEPCQPAIAAGVTDASPLIAQTLINARGVVHSVPCDVIAIVTTVRGSVRGLHCRACKRQGGSG
jgi:hypothetical protein